MMHTKSHTNKMRTLKRCFNRLKDNFLYNKVMLRMNIIYIFFFSAR
jgi:hypothetical protein